MSSTLFRSDLHLKREVMEAANAAASVIFRNSAIKDFDSETKAVNA